MADELGSLAVAIGLDATGFQTGISKVNSSLKALSSEFKAQNAALGLNGTSLDKLKLKNANLSSVMIQQQAKVNLLTTAYDKSVAACGRDSTATLELENKLNSAKRSLSNTTNAINANNTAIATQSSKWTIAGNALNATGEKLKKVGSTTTDVGKKLSVGVTAPIVGIGVAAVKVGMDFESSMSKVSAISGATGGDFKKLNDQALQLGQDTAFSAKQAADGMTDLASAGFSVNEIMVAMPGMLNLAASGGIEVSDAADIASSALRGFGLEASQSGHVADVLAKAAADTNASVTDMGMALKYAAPPAKALGMSIEETSAAIGEMANVGIKGEAAGTTLRGSLVSLASPSAEAAKQMKAIGFNAFDAQGKMLPFKDVIGKLQTSTKGLTQEQKANALATIFGKESLSGMMAMVDAGPDKFGTLTQSFKTSDGAAAAMAKTMQDNAKSGIEQMMGSLETAGIKIETAVAPTIRGIADDIQELANKFSNLNPTVQSTIIKVALVAAAIGPVVAVIGTCVTAVGLISSGLGALGILLGTSAAATTATGVAIAGTGAAAVGASTGIGAIGVAFGAALIPALPFIAAGVAVVAAGVAIHHALTQQATPAVNLFADSVVTKSKGIKDANGNISSSYDAVTTKISAATAKAVGSYMELSNKAQLALTTLFTNSTIITDKTAKGMIMQYDTMGNTIKLGMDKHNNDEITAMQTFFNTSSVLTKTEEDKAIGVENANNAAKKAAVDISTKQIDAIIQGASDHHREISLDEAQKIGAISDGMTTKAVSSLSDNEVQSKIILQRIKDYGTNITAEQASNIIKNANKQRDGSVQAANDQYTKTLGNIIQMRDGTHAITADQADKLIADAKKQRDGSITQAESLRSGAVEKVTSMNSSITSSVDTSTGNMLSKWQSLANWWGSWIPPVKQFSSTFTTTNLINTIHNDGSPAVAKSIKSRENSSGNNSFEGGYTTLHEKGYELYDLPSKTKIYNHDASEALVIQTAQEVAKGILQNKSSKNSGLTLSIENFNNTRVQDIESLMTEAAFYLKQKQLGGSRV